MIQGTGSGVGKSLVVAGLCRIFRDRGVRVAPFKAQNMALNSFITTEGGEIGRAQALQAEAARVEPSIDMNPILLKASGEAACQVIVHGKVYAHMEAQDYYGFKNRAWEAVTESYERLSGSYDLIVIEGAGSPAEINLREDEVVNMRVARHAHAPVILVGDIDKGGVFASFYGTIGLLDDEADYIKAFLINKFRGDLAILEPGNRMIEEKTGRPVIGVIPYLGDLGIHEEDGIPLERMKGIGTAGSIGRKIKVVVLRLRYISNFTDFDPFMYEPDVELLYSLQERDIEQADLIIIPGSKNTVKDLLLLRDYGIEEAINRAVSRGVPLVGICGGYQMLGKRILDPCCIESPRKEIPGMALLDTETVFENNKVTSQVKAEIADGSFPFAHDNTGASCRSWQEAISDQPLRGYEIHMGRTTGDIGLFRVQRLNDPQPLLDGSAKGSVWGTYIHGIFDDDRFRRGILNSVRIMRGLNPVREMTDYAALRDSALNAWARVLEEHIDIPFIEGLIKG